MARFHFDIQTGDTIVRDEEGMELPDLAAAGAEAEVAARELLSDAIKAKRSEVPDFLLIVDGDRNILGEVSIRDVLPSNLRR